MGKHQNDLDTQDGVSSAISHLEETKRDSVKQRRERKSFFLFSQRNPNPC